MHVREKGGKLVATHKVGIDSLVAQEGIEQTISLGKQIKLWDEFNPFLYEFETTLLVDGKQDTRTITFGMRNVEQGKHHVRLNGHDIHCVVYSTVQCFL